MQAIVRFLRDESGPTSVEYAVMLAMILGSIMAAIAAVGQDTGEWWKGIQTNLDAHGLGDT